ncbi:MAG TPA: hypothetical protein VFN65_14720, partial [Solirubrobacteraceae bacterium]|nr:hypothetical protein [Solirubrobacteraceae bacterium]
KAVPFSASDLQNIQKANPYVQRLIEDADLRDNLTTALDAGRSAYNRLMSSKAPQKAVLDDKKLHKDVSTAAEAAREAIMALGDAPKHSKPPKKQHWGRRIMLLLVGGGAALAASEGLRSKVLDLLFGAEEEFEYTPPAPAAETPPASPVTAA